MCFYWHLFCPGVGNVRNVNFNDVEGFISWDPPETAGVVGNLFYQLVVINKNTGQVIVNTTTTLTSYGLPFEPCQVYVGKVTAHVGNMAGETVVQEYRTPTSESLANSLVSITGEDCGGQCGSCWIPFVGAHTRMTHQLLMHWAAPHNNFACWKKSINQTFKKDFLQKLYRDDYVATG